MRVYAMTKLAGRLCLFNVRMRNANVFRKRAEFIADTLRIFAKLSELRIYTRILPAQQLMWLSSVVFEESAVRPRSWGFVQHACTMESDGAACFSSQYWWLASATIFFPSGIGRSRPVATVDREMKLAFQSCERARGPLRLGSRPGRGFNVWTRSRACVWVKSR